jgi:hypothetical protein
MATTDPNVQQFDLESPEYKTLLRELPALLERLVPPSGALKDAPHETLKEFVPRETDVVVGRIIGHYAAQGVHVTPAMVEHAVDELAKDDPDGKRRIGRIVVATRREPSIPDGPCYMVFSR